MIYKARKIPYQKWKIGDRYECRHETETPIMGIYLNSHLLGIHVAEFRWECKRVGSVYEVLKKARTYYTDVTSRGRRRGYRNYDYEYKESNIIYYNCKTHCLQTGYLTEIEEE